MRPVFCAARALRLKRTAAELMIWVVMGRGVVRGGGGDDDDIAGEC